MASLARLNGYASAHAPNFPIYAKAPPETFWDGVRSQIGASVDIIRSIQPFMNPGDNRLSLLSLAHEFDNCDKHELINLVSDDFEGDPSEIAFEATLGSRMTVGQARDSLTIVESVIGRFPATIVPQGLVKVTVGPQIRVQRGRS